MIGVCSCCGSMERYYHIKFKLCEKCLRHQNSLKKRVTDTLRVRHIVLQKANNCCSICGSVKNIELHHTFYPETIKEVMDCLQVLCRKCHKRVHKTFELPSVGMIEIEVDLKTKRKFESLLDYTQKGILQEFRNKTEVFANEP